MHIQRVMERAENVTRVPQANSEFVQAGTGARAGVSVGLRVRSRVRRQAHSEVVPVRHAHACAHALAVGPRPCSPRRYYLPHGPTPYPRRSSPRPYYCTYPRPYYPPAALLPAGAAVRGGPVLRRPPRLHPRALEAAVRPARLHPLHVPLRGEQVSKEESSNYTLFMYLSEVSQCK